MGFDTGKVDLKEPLPRFEIEEVYQRELAVAAQNGYPVTRNTAVFEQTRSLFSSGLTSHSVGCLIVDYTGAMLVHIDRDVNALIRAGDEMLKRVEKFAKQRRHNPRIYIFHDDKGDRTAFLKLRELMFEPCGAVFKERTVECDSSEFAIFYDQKDKKFVIYNDKDKSIREEPVEILLPDPAPSLARRLQRIIRSAGLSR